MQHSGDEATLSMGGVKAKSDKTLLNESNTMEGLEELIEKKLV